MYTEPRSAPATVKCLMQIRELASKKAGTAHLILTFSTTVVLANIDAIVRHLAPQGDPSPHQCYLPVPSEEDMRTVVLCKYSRGDESRRLCDPSL